MNTTIFDDLKKTLTKLMIVCIIILMSTAKLSAQFCNEIISGSTPSGVIVSHTISGNANYSLSNQAQNCYGSELTTGVLIGSPQGTGSVTFTFSAPQNNIQIALTPVHANDHITITTNGGTPTLGNGGCNLIVSGNTITSSINCQSTDPPFSGATGVPAAAGIVTITSAAAYTSITISNSSTSCTTPFPTFGVVVAVCEESVLYTCTGSDPIITAPAGGCVGDVLSLDIDVASGSSVSWNFGSGASPATSTSTSPTVSYSTSGTKTVTVTVTKSGCPTVTKTIYLDIFQFPTTLTWNANPNPGCTNQPIVFTPSIPDNPLYSYQWYFQNGNADDEYIRTPTVTWSATGTYNVWLTITHTTSGCVKEYQGAITINNCSNPCTTPSCSATGPSSGITGTVYTFTTGTVTPSCATVTWAAPGGTPSSGTGSTANVSWSTTGSKTVTFTVTNNCSPSGCSPTATSTCSTTINLTSGGSTPCTTPSCSATGPATGVAGTVYTFSAGSITPSCATVTWSAPGGTPSSGTGTTANVSWSTPGTYNVVFTVTNNCSPAGCSPTSTSTCTSTIVITGGSGTPCTQPKCDVSGPDTGNTGTSYTFTASYTPSCSTVTWSAPGGTPSSGTGSTANVTWNTAGNYTITFTVVNNCEPFKCDPPATSTCSWNIKISTGSTTPCDPPKCDVSGPQLGVTGTSYAFIASYNPSCSKVTWSAPGGTPSSGTGSTANVTWSTAGLYNITFTVVNDCEPFKCDPPSTSTCSWDIKIASGGSTPCTTPTCSVTGPGTGFTKTYYTFTSTYSPLCASVSWSAPGGTPSSGTGSTASIKWNNPGTYTITYTTINDCEPSGCTPLAQTTCQSVITITDPCGLGTKGSAILVLDPAGYTTQATNCTTGNGKINFKANSAIFSDACNYILCLDSCGVRIMKTVIENTSGSSSMFASAIGVFSGVYSNLRLYDVCTNQYYLLQGTPDVVVVGAVTGSPCTNCLPPDTECTPMCSTPGCNIAGPSALTIGGSGTWTVSGTNISSATWAITPTTGVSVPTSGTGTSTGTHTFSTAGTYTITFTTTNNSYPSGCTTPATSTCSYTVIVSSGTPCDPPGCSISGPSSLTSGGSGTWTVSGTNISSATWAITPTTGVSVPTSGTGTSTGTHTFSTAGTYTITFTTTNNSYPSGCTTPATSTCSYTVVVSSPTPCDPPGCSISGPSSLTSGGSGTWTVSGTNISSATWAITPTTGVSVPTSGTGTSTGTHTFSTAGTYTITFTTTNNSYPSGCTTPATSTCTYTVTVGSGCVPVTAVNITGATSATQGTSKTYTATVTPSGATAPITYNWVASDGTITSGQGTSSVTVLWTGYAGIIEVTVSNCSGSTAYNNLSVNICEAISGCTITPEAGCINQALQLSVDCTAGTPVSYNWSMPGGTPSTSTSSSPSVTYTSTGAKTVTLTLTNPCGTTSTVTKTVNIGTPPTITSPGLCLSNSQNNVSILASGCSDCTYEWDVPGASPSSGTSNPFVTSLATNAITNYTVTATNSCGMYTSSGTYNVGCVQKPTFRAGYGITFQDLDGATLSANTTYPLGVIDPSCCSQSSPTTFSFSTSGWTYVGRVMSGTCAWGYQYKFTPGTYTVTIIMPTSCGAGYEATTTATFTVN